MPWTGLNKTHRTNVILIEPEQDRGLTILFTHIPLDTHYTGLMKVLD
jgi:hypothetical protein